MPRSRGARPTASARPSGSVFASKQTPAQSRASTSMAAPAGYQAPRATPSTPTPGGASAAAPGAQPAGGAAGSGLFGQMASTAAGVAIGSSIGHALGGMFGGSGAEPAAPEQQQQQPVAAQESAWNNNNNQANNCGESAKLFQDCMKVNNGNVQPCNWYFEQLKACQSAAAPY